MTIQFQTPDGPRFATDVDGAHVVGGTPLTDASRAAIAELIAVAKEKFSDASDTGLAQRQAAALSRVSTKVAM